MGSEMIKDVVIIGAGASGLLCAIEASKRGRSVIVLEHSGRIGNKIRVSGGGHCNFTNINISHDNYISANPDFCKSPLARFTPLDFIGIAVRHGINYYEKENGQLFCNGSSGEIVNMLGSECKDSGVEISLNCRITGIKRGEEGRGFTILSNHGIIESMSLVVATGGLSYPQIGATGLGYDIARQFDLKVTSLKPALVPLIFYQSDQSNFSKLSGISVNAVVALKGRHFNGDILFTHRGLSGPAVLQISSLWESGDSISINLIPEHDIYLYFSKERRRKVEMKNLLSGLLPGRFAQTLCDFYIQSKPMNQYTDRELKMIADKLCNWTVRPARTEGYKNAEVTVGGVDTDELSSKTMEAKKVPGLYFIGEVIDVTGQLGGYNLHWAWASGYAAGQYV